MSVLDSHHTVWLSCGHGHPHAERYAVDADRLLVFGDRSLAHVPAGTHASATVYEIAGGPALLRLSVCVREVGITEVDRQAFLGLLDHVPLGRTTAEVQQSLEQHARRRLLLLEP